MTPHLHPRSRMTSSLFATTLAASLLVVALPHVLPCPVPPRITYAESGETIITDENGRCLRRKRRASSPASADGGRQLEVKDGMVRFGDSQVSPDVDDKDTARRECPVPKPGGIIGEWLGFGKKGGEGPPPPVNVKIIKMGEPPAQRPDR